MRKEVDGWHFKENWFLRNIWGSNSWCIGGIGGVSRSFPKNLCSLFWGSIFGMLIATPCFFVVFIWITIGVIIKGFFGFYPDSRDVYLSSYPYKYIGGEKKIPVAAWEVCAIGYCVYILVTDFVSWKNSAISLFGSLFGQLANSIALVIIVAATVIAGVFFFLFKTTAGKVIREYIKSAIQKVCPSVVIDP